MKIVDFGLNQVFQNPNVFTTLLFVQRKTDEGEKTKHSAMYIKVSDQSLFPHSINSNIFYLSKLDSLYWKPINSLVNKLLKQKFKLEDMAFVKDVGLNYWTKGRGKKRSGSIADRVLYHGEQQHIDDKPYLKGRNILRYSFTFGKYWLRHDCQTLLDSKIDVFRYNPKFLEQEKIIYRQTADSIIATRDIDKFLTDKTLHSIILKTEWEMKINLHYLLGLLNSKLMTYFYKSVSQEEGRTFAQVKIFRIKKLPIHVINFSDPTDKSRHDRMVSLVETMLTLHKQSAHAKTGHDKDVIQRQTDATDRQIDTLVYELYGLTEEEIRIVEGENR